MPNELVQQYIPGLHILVIDDDPNIRQSIHTYLSDRGHKVTLAATGTEGLNRLQKTPTDIVITDVQMPGIDGFEVLQEVQRLSPQTDVIMITGFQEIENAFRAMREGAFDFFTKPLRIQDLSASLQRTIKFQTLRREKQHAQTQLENLSKKSNGLVNILGQSNAIQTIRDQIHQVSQTDHTAVLITGETGTGKELVARAIHAESARSTYPFIAVNCSALTETLIESQLFGHEKGAFTDAKTSHKGHFEQAQGGSLFLDEIGDMPLVMQTRLLRTLEERTIRRVGGTQNMPINVRIISATNRDLSKAISEGAFREDLFYRLNTVALALPPLRERPEDIPLLAQTFLQHNAQEIGKTLTGFTPDALKSLQIHPFLGNVRELRNLIERAVIFCQSPQISPTDLLFHQRTSTPTEISFDITKLADINLANIEKTLVTEALRRTHNNLTQAARLLGISREMVRTRMRTYGLKTD